MRAGHLAPPDTAHPILLSYIDVVMEGYLDHFGRDGLDRFVASTEVVAEAMGANEFRQGVEPTDTSIEMDQHRVVMRALQLRDERTMEAAQAAGEPILPTALQGPPGQFGTYQQEWSAHWTRAVENFIDFTHPPYAHRDTIGAYSYDFAERGGTAEIDVEVLQHVRGDASRARRHRRPQPCRDGIGAGIPSRSDATAARRRRRWSSARRHAAPRRPARPPG